MAGQPPEHHYSILRERLLPMPRLVAAFAFLLVSYYWTQVRPHPASVQRSLTCSLTFKYA